MTKTHQLHRSDYQRLLTNSFASVRNAYALRDLLAANPLPGNSYYDDAMQRADELVGEMEDDLSYTIESAMRAGFGPEDFES